MLRALLLAAATVPFLAPATQASAQAMPSTTQGPITKILAIGHIVGAPSPNMRSIMPAEVHDTVQLYLDGKIDQWFARKDKNGVVFLMNCSTVEEAHTLLEKLPLGVNKVMEFDLIPLGPLSPLRVLLTAPAAPTAAPAQ